METINQIKISVVTNFPKFTVQNVSREVVKYGESRDDGECCLVIKN